MEKPLSFLSADPNQALRSYRKEEEDLLRDKFARDRDRILFSKEFRRLMGKTQVFVSGFDDHIRNRLTHTLEVSQIAQSISKYFGFNLTLTESISLGHDVGHTPFGHVGERLLNLITNNCDSYKDFRTETDAQKGFKHNWQGIKVVSTLEKISTKYKGLNLTDYTLWGILNHSNLKYRKCEYYSGSGICNYRHKNEACQNTSDEFCLDYYYRFSRLINNESWSFEALVVRLADEIAQRHHDIEDGLVAHILDRKDLVDTFASTFDPYLNKNDKIKLNTIKKSQNINYVLHDLSSLILGFYSINLISNSEVKISDLLKKYNLNQSSKEFFSIKKAITENEAIFNLINYDPDYNERDKKFQEYLYNRILNSHLAQTMDGKANFILRRIIHAYLSNPKQLPDSTIITFFSNYLSDIEFNKLLKSKSLTELAGKLRNEINNLHNRNNDKKYKSIILRTIVDMIAGMTDSFALSQYRMLYEGETMKKNNH